MGTGSYNSKNVAINSVSSETNPIPNGGSTEREAIISAGGSTEVSMGGSFWDRPWRMNGIIGRESGKSVH